VIKNAVIRVVPKVSLQKKKRNSRSRIENVPGCSTNNRALILDGLINSYQKVSKVNERLVEVLLGYVA
jgi:hypothetical protein